MNIYAGLTKRLISDHSPKLLLNAQAVAVTIAETTLTFRV